MELTKMQKNFLGQEFITKYGSKLVVESFHGKDHLNKGVFTVSCSVCSLDLELYPDRVFTIRKDALQAGVVPCGCTGYKKFTEHQYKILTIRHCKVLGIEFIDWVGGFCGWESSINTYSSSYNKCHVYTNLSHFLRLTEPVLSQQGKIKVYKNNSKIGQNLIPKEEREFLIKTLLKQETGMFIGWSGEYTGSFTKFTWECKNQHVQESSVSSFINNGKRCLQCFKNTHGKGLYGYYKDRDEEEDYLYLIEFKKR